MGFNVEAFVIFECLSSAGVRFYYKAFIQGLHKPVSETSD